MTLNLAVGARYFTAVALAVALALIGDTAIAQSIKGTATYRERMALPPGAVFEAVIEDAVFTAGAQVSPASPASGLDGSSWQLVKFRGGDDTTLTPDDHSKYPIELDAGGQLTARINCNRGRGTWKSSGPNQLQFGPLALTRAQCPPGSLHDHLVKQWSFIRSYVMKDGHLFLSLMADGGIYEFEPVKKPKP